MVKIHFVIRTDRLSTILEKCIKKIRAQIPVSTTYTPNTPISSKLSSKMDQVIFHSDRFEILIDLRGFRPEEIKCVLTARTVEVIGQNAQQMENAQKILYLVRQYLLPKNASPEQGHCCLSAEGMLLITAPWIM